MIWVLFSLAAALGDALKGALNKRMPVDEYTAAWCASALGAPVLLAAILLGGGFPELTAQFWIALFASGIINVMASTLYVRAIKSSDLSVTLPMAAFTPLFLLITSPFINGEFPGVVGLAGVLLIVAGSYMLNLRSLKAGVLGPFKALLREPGPRIMLLVAFMWSISSNFDKIGIQNSSPVMWGFSVASFIAVALLPAVVAGGKLRRLAGCWKMAGAVGLIQAASLLAHATAIGLTLVAYAISVKRLSILFGVGLGGYVFKERDIAAKALAALVMLAGVILIAFS